jgi:hypothetical protein
VVKSAGAKPMPGPTTGAATASAPQRRKVTATSAVASSAELGESGLPGQAYAGAHCWGFNGFGAATARSDVVKSAGAKPMPGPTTGAATALAPQWRRVTVTRCAKSEDLAAESLA